MGKTARYAVVTCSHSRCRESPAIALHRPFTNAGIPRVHVLTRSAAASSRLPRNILPSRVITRPASVTPVPHENKRSTSAGQPNSCRRRATLTSGLAPIRPRSMTFEYSSGAQVRGKPAVRYAAPRIWLLPKAALIGHSEKADGDHENKRLTRNWLCSAENAPPGEHAQKGTSTHNNPQPRTATRPRPAI